MSYDCSMKTKCCDSTKCEIGNMTSNVSPMWTLALGGTRLADLEGKTGRELVPLFEAAVAHIRHPDHRAQYQAMNPENGWGSHESAAEYLDKLLAACREWHDCVLDISN